MKSIRVYIVMETRNYCRSDGFWNTEEAETLAVEVYDNIISANLARQDLERMAASLPENINRNFYVQSVGYTPEDYILSVR